MIVEHLNNDDSRSETFFLFQRIFITHWTVLNQTTINCFSPKLGSKETDVYDDRIDDVSSQENL